MKRSINKAGVIGAGTMGAGIAGVCAAAGLPVVLLDLTEETAQKAVTQLTSGKKPILTEDQASLISCGAIDANLDKLADADWICEVIIENLEAKQTLFQKVDKVRKDGSIITSNTSGIPLRDICQGMSDQFNRDVAVTHFFNPVHIMRLLELVPGEHTDPDVITSLADFFGSTLNKGVVYAKDTVNFIGNRIGCFWILAGLHKGIAAQTSDTPVTMETIDALLSKPIGLPPTGLYGLVDLVGLDIMEHVAKNLRTNLPKGDVCFQYLDFPEAERNMIEQGQLGRKTGGGYYKLLRGDDGSKTMTLFDLSSKTWRNTVPATLEENQLDYRSLLLEDSAEGQFTWELMSETLCYSADLVPEIADDIVNIDRAMRWGFNWSEGPFELLDGIGCENFIARLRAEKRAVPAMLTVLESSPHSSFYKDGQFLDTTGSYQDIPPE